MQIRYASGFVIETLHPEEIDDAPPHARRTEPGRPDHQGAFVDRFLGRDGPGVHHITFIVDDLDAAMASLSKSGREPGVVDRADSYWHEASYSARVTNGVVLQLVQLNGPAPVAPEAPEGFPELGFEHPVASFGRVVHAVADLDDAVSLFRDALGGHVTSSGAAVDGNHWVELGWDGPGRLRLLEAAHGEIAEWVGDAPGRIRHLYFTFDDPESIPGARRVARGRWVIDDDCALGTRIVMSTAVREG